MSYQLKHIDLPDFTLSCGKKQSISVSYQIYGQQLHTAPIILVNHALTGNSSVVKWWSQVVGPEKSIDTNQYTVICIDIPGNGNDKDIEHLIFNYQEWTLKDVAIAFKQVLDHLRVHYVDIGIGGSIGGSLLWEMTVAFPYLMGTIIPIASDWKATDWVIANCHVQERILNHSSRPLEDARTHAMTFYRTPQSLRRKFNREKTTDFKVTNWLDHHGENLKKRFFLPAYKLVNKLLSTANAARDYDDNITKALAASDTKIRLISIDSDAFFVAQEDEFTYDILKNYKDIKHNVITSEHGHDAFLIEYDQLNKLLKNILEDIKIGSLKSSKLIEKI